MNRHDAFDVSDDLAQVLESLAELVRYVRRVGGFMEHEDQMTLRRAIEVLEQHRRPL